MAKLRMAHASRLGQFYKYEPLTYRNSLWNSSHNSRYFKVEQFRLEYLYISIHTSIFNITKITWENNLFYPYPACGGVDPALPNSIFLFKSLYHFQMSPDFMTFPKYVIGTPWIIKQLPNFVSGLLVRKKRLQTC